MLGAARELVKRVLRWVLSRDGLERDSICRILIARRMGWRFGTLTALPMLNWR